MTMRVYLLHMRRLRNLLICTATCLQLSSYPKNKCKEEAQIVQQKKRTDAKVQDSA